MVIIIVVALLSTHLGLQQSRLLAYHFDEKQVKQLVVEQPLGCICGVHNLKDVLRSIIKSKAMGI